MKKVFKTLALLVWTLSTFSFGFPESLSEKRHLKSVEPKDVDVFCPNETMIAPCTCVDGSFQGEPSTASMYCTYVNTDEQLRSIFAQEFPSDNLNSLYMGRNDYTEIIELTKGVFGTKTFRTVKIQQVSFGVDLNIFDPMADRLERIELFNMPNVKNFEHDFRYFTKLNSISLSADPLEDVHIISPTLESIYIGETFIDERKNEKNYNLGPMENLQSLSFYTASLTQTLDTSDYPKLKHLTMVENQITLLTGIPWPTETYLGEFRAYYNIIQDIDPAYLKMSNGSVVYLDHNQLTLLEQDKWEAIFNNASLIHIYENPFECGCEIAWIFGADPSGTPYLHKLSNLEKCANGTPFRLLRPDDYANCTLTKRT